MSMATIVIVAYLVSAAAWSSVTSALTMLWPEAIHIHLLAVSIAAINSVASIRAFVGPYGWGIVRDSTGSYLAGLVAHSAIAFLTIIPILILRRQLQVGRAALAATVP